MFGLVAKQFRIEFDNAKSAGSPVDTAFVSTPSAEHASFRDKLPILLLVLGFFLWGTLHLPDYGITIDEGETHSGGSAAVQAVQDFFSGNPMQFGAHELPGFYFIFDLIRGTVAYLLVDSWQITDTVIAYHSVHVALSALSLWFLWKIAWDITGSAFLSNLAAMSLVLLPKFLGHAQNNPKDLPALFVFVMAIQAGIAWLKWRGTRRALWAGAALGLALATRELSVLVPAVLLLWFRVAAGRFPFVSKKEFLAFAGPSGIVFFLGWPWLWANPPYRLAWAVYHAGNYAHTRLVLYFGQLARGTDLPWHYFLGSFLVCTPVLFLISAAVGLRRLSFQRSRHREGRRSLICLALIWCVLPILLEMNAPSHYDGVRHLLLIFPAFALLVASGMEEIIQLLSRNPVKRSPVATILVTLLILGGVAVQVYWIHPYQDSYLNEVTNAVIPGSAEQYFETEYWGHAYKEGAAWLQRNIEPDAEVYILPSTLAHFYLDRLPKIPAEGDFFDLSRPRYFIHITRRGFYDDLSRKLELEYAPVFEIRRQKGSLLKIYRNDQKRSGSLSAALPPQ